MTDLESIINQFRTFSEEALQRWLSGYLMGSSVEPILLVPAGYLTPAEYLVTILREVDTASFLLGKFGTVADAIFLEGLAKDAFLPPSGNADLLLNLLHLIEAFPSERSLPTIRALVEMARNEDYKGWPNESDDVFRFILMALAGRIQTAKFIKVDELAQFLEDPEYAGMAFCAIARLDIKHAIEQLPRLINLLKAAGQNHRGFLLDFPGRVGQDEDKWRLIAGYLAGQDFEDTVALLHSSLECWEWPETAEFFLHAWEKATEKQQTGEVLIFQKGDLWSLRLPIFGGRAVMSNRQLEQDLFPVQIAWAFRQYCQYPKQASTSQLQQNFKQLFVRAIELDCRNTGWEIGKVLGTLVNSWDTSKLIHIWDKGVFPAIYEPNGENVASPFFDKVAHDILLGFFSYNIHGRDEFGANIDNIRSDFREALFSFRPTEDQGPLNFVKCAKSLVDAAAKCNITSIKVKIDGYPESRFEAWTLHEVVKKGTNDDLRVEPISSQYTTEGGRASSCHIELKNDLPLAEEDRQPENFIPLFDHVGYYAFVRADWLKQLNEHKDKVPDPVKKMIIAILENRKRDEIKKIKDHVFAKAWLAHRAGFCKLSKKSLERTEYDIIQQLIEKYAKEYAAEGDELADEEIIPIPPRTYGPDHRLSQFLRPVHGKLDEKNSDVPFVFAGGSVHARLLLRWWLPCDDVRACSPVRLLLDENDFKDILNSKSKWPIRNGLVRGGLLTDKNGKASQEKKEFFIAVGEVCKEISRLFGALADLFKQPGETRDTSYIHPIEQKALDDANTILLGLQNVLVPPPRGRNLGRRISSSVPEFLSFTTSLPEAEWSFLSDPEDMKNFLAKDNNFKVTADNTSGGPREKKKRPEKKNIVSLPERKHKIDQAQKIKIGHD